MRRLDCRLPELAWVMYDGWLPRPGVGVGLRSLDGVEDVFGSDYLSDAADGNEVRVGRVLVLRCNSRAA